MKGALTNYIQSGPVPIGKPDINTIEGISFMQTYFLRAKGCHTEHGTSEILYINLIQKTNLRPIRHLTVSLSEQDLYVDFKVMYGF